MTTSNPAPRGHSAEVQDRLTAYGRAIEHANIASALAVDDQTDHGVQMAVAHAQTSLAWSKIAQLSGRNTHRRPAGPDTHRGQ